jgi:diguanylate cyclase (GGDEF)-like protein
VQLYFIITAPIAFILFEARDRTLRLALAASSLVFYFIAELVPSLALAGELEPSLYRAIVLANIAVVSLVILLIQAAFLNEIDRRELALQLLARTDQLTGLLNRRALLECSEAQVSQSARHAQPLTVLMIDIDHFKRINDEHGHVAGDRTLVEVADAMRQIMRLEDQLGRFDGEEFVALLPLTNSVAARSMAEKLRERVAALSVALEGGVVIQCTVSLGLASLRPGETSIDPVLSRADLAMYQAKAQGRNRCVLYDD